MAKVIFRGARVRFADVREGKAGVYTRIYITAVFSDVVRRAMGWGVNEDGVLTPMIVNSGKLGGEIHATHIILTPNGKELRKHELQLDVEVVDDFQYFRVTDSDSESISEEVRFTVHTAVSGAAGLLENYMRKIGTSDKSVGQLRIAYEEQMELGEPPADDAEEGGTCVDCNNGIALVDGDPTMHVSGQPCAAYEGDGEGGPALASVAQMGSGHRKRGRGQIVEATAEPVN